MALLTQRIVRDQPFGAADGFRPALVVFLLAGEPLERVGLEPREPFAFVRQPLVIAALQQLTGVQLDRFFELPPGHRPLELLDVQPQRRIRAPPQRARSDFDQASASGSARRRLCRTLRRFVCAWPSAESGQSRNAMR